MLLDCWLGWPLEAQGSRCILSLQSIAEKEEDGRGDDAVCWSGDRELHKMKQKMLYQFFSFSFPFPFIQMRNLRPEEDQ